MASLVQKILIGASVVAGMTTVSGAPALAQWTVEGTDVIKYEAVDTNGDGTVDTTQANSAADVNAILQKMDGTPGGNIELFAGSETVQYDSDWDDYYNFDFWGATGGASITGEVNGKSLTLSSLNADDWFTTDDGGFNYDYYGATTLANRWFDDLINAVNAVGNQDIGDYWRGVAYAEFYEAYGFERASDPNISYIESGSNGIEIGLAGHLNLGDTFESEDFLASIFSGVQASEVVKVEYDGVVNYLYSFEAVASGLRAADDGTSHNGLYKVTVPGTEIASVPEPSTMLGLMAVGGLFAASKRKSAKNS
jgi:hypothetical protein